MYYGSIDIIISIVIMHVVPSKINPYEIMIGSIL